MAKDSTNQLKYIGVGLLSLAVLAPNLIELARQRIIHAIDPTNRNLKAFLLMLRWCEGTDVSDGYNIMFGFRRFTSFADHPRQYFDYTDKSGKKIKTSAAGAYQFIWSTWDRLRKKLGLKDFSPASQDLAVAEYIAELGAYGDIIAGRFDKAIYKLRKVWASLPNSNVNQPTKRYADVVAKYKQYGGSIA